MYCIADRIVDQAAFDIPCKPLLNVQACTALAAVMLLRWLLGVQGLCRQHGILMPCCCSTSHAVLSSCDYAVISDMA